MRNAETIRKRLDAVKKQKDPQVQITELADIQYEIGISACEDRGKLQLELDNLRKVIIGNGDPENSLLSRMSKVEGNLGGVKGDTEEIKEALLGNIKKHEAGLLDRVDDLEKVGRKIDAIFWFLVFEILAVIVAAIMELL